MGLGISLSEIHPVLGVLGRYFFLLFKDLVSEESLLAHISKYLTILENGAWMVVGVTAFVGRSGMWCGLRRSWGGERASVWDQSRCPRLGAGECLF